MTDFVLGLSSDLKYGSGRALGAALQIAGARSGAPLRFLSRSAEWSAAPNFAGAADGAHHSDMRSNSNFFSLILDVN